MEANTFKREVRITEDGSKTIYIPEMDENYHSFHGALQEARHVFIQHGLLHTDQKELSVLEVGFGTGLNALLTALEAEKENIKVSYFGLEAYPVEREILAQMDYCLVISESNCQLLYDAIHTSEFGKKSDVSTFFSLEKIQEKLEDYIPGESKFDLIYFDAFGPRAQADMWNKEHFEKLYHAVKPGGIFVTYCAKGQVKRDLKAVGFSLEALPGPPGKREMTRGRK